jgi:glyoxylase-like metal-dependent hydrolase (beta-lactamase superfamily II)
MGNQNEPFSIKAMELGPMENFIYLIRDIGSDRVAVVDPAWEGKEIIEQVKKDGLKITDILLTHSHFDHINAIEDILKEYDAQVHLLKAEAKFWGHYQDIPTLHYGGDKILLGDTEISVLHTPGHTPGSACYHVGNHLIAGDTLFVFGCGRCDLAGGDPEQMFDTLNRLKIELPQGTILHPGHNYAEKEISTMKEQIEGNPFLHFDNPADFVHYRMHEHDKIRDTPYHPVPGA